MTPDEYRAAIASLGLSQGQAGDFLGVHSVTSRRWATGKLPIPDAVSTLLRLMIAMKLTPDKVREWIDAS